MSSGLELKDASTPPSLDGLEREERVEAMVEWFLDNFEDPAEHTPHESAEGGYQYIWGGPYDALDQISSTFPEAEQDEIEEAVEEVQSDGIYDWAPSDGRVQPDDYDDLDDGLELDGGPAPAPLSDRLEALGEQLGRIEGHVAALLKLRDEDQAGVAGIGHNRPPEDVDGPIDLAAVQESIDDVRTELAKPDRENDADAEKLALAETRFRRFLSWVKQQVAKAPGNLVKGAVTAAGGLMFTYVVRHHQELLAALEPAVATVGSWMMAVQTWF
jgi:hypothetical protein